MCGGKHTKFVSKKLCAWFLDILYGDSRCPCKLYQNPKSSIFVFQHGGLCSGEYYSLQHKVEVEVSSH